MNSESPFSTMFLAAALASSGATSADEIRLVRPATYQSRACWFDERGRFVAFLVLGREDRIAVPYLISTRCIVSAGYGSLGEATINHLNAIRLVDPYGVLQRALPEFTVSDNDRTDQPRPSGDDHLYYLRARVARVPSRYLTVYAPRNFVVLREVDMSFQRFLRLSKEERERLSRIHSLR